MKAATINQAGEIPRYAEIDEPSVQNDHEVLVQVKAVAIKNLDKSKASGKHYSSEKTTKPVVVGTDGVGISSNGQRIYGVGVNGTMAEKAVFLKDWTTPVPENLDGSVAAALPNAIMGSAMALRFRAGLQAGETVLINGATGITGKIAIQLARQYGAGKIIVTGRNEEVLQTLPKLGADILISLNQDDEAFVAQLKSIHALSPINVAIDYLWSHAAEMILSALKGKGTFSPKTRFVSVGAMAGDNITLSSQILRSIDLQLSGSGLGSWTKEEVNLLFSEILPEAFQLAADQKLKMEVATVQIQDIEKAWDMEIAEGKRLVVTI
jgi:NADPH:quinone reductase-like Zn-dependent oxidoreductase